MRNILMLFSVFALFVTLTASLAHAENHCENGAQASVNCDSEHIDTQAQNDSSSDECCDMSCGGCGMHCHHSHISSSAHNALTLKVFGKDQRSLDRQSIHISDLIYGLKRPPKA